MTEVLSEREIAEVRGGNYTQVIEVCDSHEALRNRVQAFRVALEKIACMCENKCERVAKEALAAAQ